MTRSRRPTVMMGMRAPLRLCARRSGVQHVPQVPQVHGGYPGPGQAQMVHQAQRLRSGPAPGMPSPGMMAAVYHQGMQQAVMQQSMHPYGVDPDGRYVQLPPLPDSTQGF